MELKQIRIRNFRCYHAETTIDIEALTALVGRNDSGKSAILDALAMFFGEYAPDSDDANIHGDKSDIAVICEFVDLPSDVLIDTKNRVSPAKEWLLNGQKALEIHRIFNGALQKPKLARTFLVAQHPTAKDYADLLYLNNRALKMRAKELAVSLDGVDQRTNSSLRQAIWAAAPALDVGRAEIDIEKEDAKRIWAVLSKQLPLFALFRSDRKSTDQDEEAQDPLKSAISEALKTQEAELERVTEIVRTQVLKMARATMDKLREMDPDLAQELNPRFTKPNWARVFGVSLTDDEQIPIDKRGSGVRRLILLNFFRARAEERLATADATGIIYAIEEPETSQHPRNQRLLLSALRELSEQPGCQVIISTHTPVLVRDLPLAALRHVTAEKDGARRVLVGDETYSTIANELGVIADHGVKLFIGVEGVNDIEFLCNISAVLRREGEDVPDLRALEEEGSVVFIPVGGSNLVLWTHRLAKLRCPEFHLYDRDEEPPASSGHQDAVDEITARGAVAVLTGKREMENYLHPEAIERTFRVTVAFGDFDDVPELVAREVHRGPAGASLWSDLAPDKQRKKVSRAKRRLNSEAVLAMTPELLDASDPDNDVRTWLGEIARLLKE